MEAPISKSFQRGGEIGTGPRILTTPDQQITALPIRPFKESHSSLSATQTRTYGRALSHHPQASFSSHISPDPFSHRRRGSTLKVVMRKIFGKKRQSNLDEDEYSEEPLAAVRKPPVDSVPGRNRMLFETAHQLDSSSGPCLSKRKESLPISHLSSSSSNHVVAGTQDQRIEISTQVIRRRATLPSLILTEDDDTKKSMYSSVSPLSTQPVSVLNETYEDQEEQEDHEEHEDHQGHEDSKSQHSFRAHRRSRSADALRELVRHHRMSPIQWRRRSDEIKFWRTSVLETDQDEEDQADEALESRLETSKTEASSSQDRKESTDAGLPLQNEPTPAPFQFESLIASMADPDATVEQRLTTIEVKLMDLEFAISKIQGTDNNVFPKSAESSFIGHAKTSDSKYLTANTANETASVLSEVSTQSSASFGGGEGRPISTSTLRPSMVYPQPAPWQSGAWSSMNLNNISIEQYSALVTLVRREQTARKALENQVTQLQEEMQQMRRASGIPASPPGTLYPIPSPDSDDGKFRRRRHTNSTRKDSSNSADTRASESRARDSSKYLLI